ncbi:hypothetical protein HAX54_005494 [Datura stramonium]|uniref:Uncharacterized protein n=1 Tax=Datura stramonium TaxID=4076 RepID=A0ABS8T8V9_DATST|nr:hypothetical protein [Datura stramonium]
MVSCSSLAVEQRGREDCGLKWFSSGGEWSSSWVNGRGEGDAGVLFFSGAREKMDCGGMGMSENREEKERKRGYMVVAAVCSGDGLCCQRREKNRRRQYEVFFQPTVAETKWGKMMRQREAAVWYWAAFDRW